MQLSGFVVLLFSLSLVEAKSAARPRPIAATALPRIDASTVSVSGISAGGAFAVQFATAYSTLIHAIGVVAGIPYLCSGGSLAGALTCMNDAQLIDLGSLLTQTELLSALGRIDNITNVAGQYVQLFSGTMDTVVSHATMLVVQSMYKALGVTDMVTFWDYPAEHAWITDNFGNPCSYLGAPFVNNCGLDFAGIFLQSTFKKLGLRWNTTRGPMYSSNLRSFSQVPYGADPLLNSLATDGYVYIPASCQIANTTCHLHVNFHGCEQEASAVGVEYVLNAGLNEWAETNSIVVLYPQAASNVLLDNPNACFDWWGYASPNYAVRGGGQLGIMRQILQGFAGI